LNNSGGPIEFNLDGHDYIELKNLLKVSNLCDSGGAAKFAIDQGQVSVDGIVETRKALKVKAGQTVTFQGKTIKVVQL
jgi:ribosome-associated protein